MHVLRVYHQDGIVTGNSPVRNSEEFYGKCWKVKQKE